MATFKESTTIKLPISTVFTFISNRRENSKALENIIDSQKTTAGPIKKGTKYLLIKKSFMREYEKRLEIIEIRKNDFISFQAKSGIFTYIYNYTFLEIEKNLTGIDFVGIIRPSILGKILKPILIDKIDRNHLTHYKNYLENNSGDNPDPKDSIEEITEIEEDYA